MTDDFYGGVGEIHKPETAISLKVAEGETIWKRDGFLEQIATCWFWQSPSCLLWS